MRIVGKNIARFFAKPEQSLLVDVIKLNNGNKNISLDKARDVIDGKLLEPKLAELGTTSVQIERKLKEQFPAAKKEIENIFLNLDSVAGISARPKGSVSIITKLEREFLHGAPIKSFDDAYKIVRDGIGDRILLKPLQELSSKEIKKMIQGFRLDGKELSKKEMQILEKYVYNHPMSKDEMRMGFPIFEKFSRPLIEKQTQQAVDYISLGIIKDRMNKGLSIAEIKEKGLLSEELLQKLQTEDIKPINFSLINNYRGEFGLPTFTNGQLQQIERAAGGNITIISRPDVLDFDKYPKEYLDKMKKCIRQSGYRTCQGNIVHQNGANGECQFRDILTNNFAEYEHIAYDLRMGKNTLGPLFNDYKKEISKLSDAKYEKYTEYLQQCYNYYNRKSLGLPAKKPSLPKGFNKILSEDNMKKLHDANELRLKDLGKNFTQYFEEVA